MQWSCLIVVVFKTVLLHLKGSYIFRFFYDSLKRPFPIEFLIETDPNNCFEIPNFTNYNSITINIYIYNYGLSQLFEKSLNMLTVLQQLSRNDILVFRVLIWAKGNCNIGASKKTTITTITNNKNTINKPRKLTVKIVLRHPNTKTQYKILGKNFPLNLYLHSSFMFQLVLTLGSLTEKISQ